MVRSDTASDERDAGWLRRTMLAPAYPQPVRFRGRVLFVMLESPADLRPWVPAALEVPEPAAAFLKVYRLRMRPLTGRPRPPAYSQYQQVCLTVSAAPAGHPPGHYNILLWESRDWSIGPDVLGWRKKLAEIDQTATFPTVDRFDHPSASALFRVDVALAGRPLIEVRARLDGTSAAPDPGVSGGFWSVTHRGDGDPAAGTPTAEATRIDVEDLHLGPPVTGPAEVAFHRSSTYSREENDLMDVLTRSRIGGAALRDVGWLRPSTPPVTVVVPR